MQWKRGTEGHTSYTSSSEGSRPNLWNAHVNLGKVQRPVVGLKNRLQVEVVADLLHDYSLFWIDICIYIFFTVEGRARPSFQWCFHIQTSAGSWVAMQLVKGWHSPPRAGIWKGQTRLYILFMCNRFFMLYITYVSVLAQILKKRKRFRAV